MLISPPIYKARSAITSLCTAPEPITDCKENSNESAVTVTEKKPSKVVTLSNRQLNNTEIAVLSRGLKYNSADANYVDFLGNLESILQGSTIPEDVCIDI